MDHDEVLSFLFTLSSLEVGQEYSTANLTPTQLRMLDDLGDFGIIYRKSDDSSGFYPTRLATTLTSDSTALSTSLSTSGGGVSAKGSLSSNLKGFIIIETNYRIYAYTNSPLRISILNLFTKLISRYPNMVSGRLTKESIQKAIERGITSQQIISYLTAHAHPAMNSHSHGADTATNSYSQQQQQSIPPTVVDQIRLWQIENDRMTTTSGFLLKDFTDRQEYDDCAKYAETIGVLKWQNDASRLLFVTSPQQIASYINSRKKRLTEENGTGKVA